MASKKTTSKKGQRMNYSMLKLDGLYYQKVASARQQLTDFEHYVHINEIIVNRAFDFENAYHREFVARAHPFMKRFIIDIAEMLSKNTPIFTTKDQKDEENPKPIEKLVKFWEDNNLGKMLSVFLKKCRTHGWAIYYPVTDVYPSYYSRNAWYVYSPPECEQIEWDAYGHPTKFHVKATGKNTTEFDISITECVFYDHELTLDYSGEPVGRDIWDDLIDYLFIKESMKSFAQRLGNGFMVIGVPESTTDTEISSIKENMKHVRTEVGLLVRQSSEDPVTVEWQQTGVQSGYVDHLAKYEDAIAVGMGMPKRWLLGDQEGAMESSGKDKIQVEITLKGIFSKFVDFIKSVLIYHGQIAKEDDVVILPHFEVNLSEIEVAQIEQLRTQTIASKTWATIDEKRQMDGMDPLTAEQRSEVEAQQQPQSWGDNGQQRGDNERQRPSAQKKVDSFEDMFLGNSVRDLSEIFGLSPTTIAKIRSKLDEENRIHKRQIDMTVKCDSVSDSTVEFSGYLLTPGELKYDDSEIMDVRTIDEIRAFFNGNTVKQIYGGVNSNDSHDSPVAAEIIRDEAVAIAEMVEVNENGLFIRGKLDLNEVDKRLGSRNWIRERVERHEPIPISAALYSKDRIRNGKRYNTDLDVRSFVFTRLPRNKNTKVMV